MSSSEFYHYEEVQNYVANIGHMLDEVVEFWTKHSNDEEHGGFFTCLAKDGTVYDTTKYSWLQGRQVWMYCQLYTTYDRFRKPEILNAAVRGGKFLKKLKDPSSGKVFFSCTREGLPLKMQRTMHSEEFYTLANIGLAKATKDPSYKAEAIDMFKKIIRWVRVDPSGMGRPQFSGNKPVSSMSPVMGILNLLHEFEDLEGLKHLAIQESELDLKEIRTWAVKEIMKHVQRDGTRILETVTPDAQEIPGSIGRLMNPGHAIECGWMLIKESERVKDFELKQKALKHFVEAPLCYGKDVENGGIFYFMDVDDLPPQQLEYDMKLFWVHCEALIALGMKFMHVRDYHDAWEEFKQMADYAFLHFVDKEYGEWFGYLSKENHVKIDCKGGSYKGCYHVPRALMICEQLLMEHLNHRMSHIKDPN